MAGFLNRLFGRQAEPVDPAVVAEEKRKKWINTVNSFFELPWDGRNRLRAASKEVLHDIGEIYDTAKREEYLLGDSRNHLPIRRPIPWFTRDKYMGIAMDKLGYTADEIKERHQEIREKYHSHFPSPKAPS